MKTEHAFEMEAIMKRYASAKAKGEMVGGAECVRATRDMSALIKRVAAEAVAESKAKPVVTSELDEVAKMLGIA